MKVVVDQAVRGSRRFVQPVIPLERPKTRDFKKNEVLTFKLRSNPKDENSLTYDLSIPFFREGTPEELLMFMTQVDKVIAGMNISDGPNKFALVRRLLQGDALAAFDNAATMHGAETNDNFNLCGRDLVRHIFPTKALAKQKRWMRRFLRKPAEMSIRDFMSRMTEINGYLKKFPPFGADQSLPQEEILDIAEFGTPNSWQKQMVVQGFDPVNNTVSAFVEFCERLEQTESFKEKEESPKKAKATTGKRKSNEKEKSYYCKVHKKNSTHDTEDCLTLKNANGTGSNKHFKSKTWERKKSEKDLSEKEQMMLSAFKKAMKEHFTMEPVKEETSSKEDPPAADEIEDLDGFENFNISDDEDDSDDESKE